MNDLLTKEAADLFESLDWPKPDQEEWRRTDLSRLLPAGTLDAGVAASRDGSAAPDADVAADPFSGTAPLLPRGYAARIVTRLGRPEAAVISPEAAEAGLRVDWRAAGDLPEDLSRMGGEELEASGERVTSWHWRDLPGALVIRLPGNARVEGPVVVEERIAGGGAAPAGAATVSLPHLHVEAGESAELRVVWSFEGDPAAGGPEGASPAPAPVVNAGLSASAAANASLDLTVRQRTGLRTAFFLHDRLVAGRDARIRFREAHFGGALVKTRARTLLDGPGSDVVLKGLYVVSDSRHMDIGTLQEHRSPNAFSDALYKGAVRPGGRSVFQGLIEVDPVASKTDAYLTNNNLVLGDGARADSLPQLNILTDDVKCSHGSTTGKIDPAQLFYLKSRGFSSEEAQRELVRGFLAEVIDGVPGAVSEILAEDLDAALSVGEN